MTDQAPSWHTELESIALDADILTHLLCYRCERHFEQHSESDISDVGRWSHEAATRAVRAGWRYLEREVVCPDCLARKHA